MDAEGEVERVPFATWDPDQPATNAGPHSSMVEPVRVTLGKGDMLYLPAMWCVSLDLLIRGNGGECC